VSDLIDPTTKTWKEDIVREIFYKPDADEVLQINIPSLNGDDFIAWNKSKNYMFSVRSAYYLEWEHQFGTRMRRADGQGTEVINPVWSTLWSLDVPAKIKKIGWKALHGLVPGRGILANRHIKVSAQCPVCSSGCEDIKHLMFTCKRAKEVWKELGLEDYIRTACDIDHSGSVVLEEILRGPLKNNPVIGLLGLKETILVAAWYIWWQRREVVKGETVAPVKKSVFSIQAITANYRASSHVTVPKDNGWTKPPPSNYKMNVDACFFPSGAGAVAAVIRDSKGSAMAGGAWPMTNMLDVGTAEALALKRGQELLERIKCSPTIIESDNMALVDACNGERDIWIPSTAILMDCFNIIQRIGFVSVNYCPRKSNRVAHNLARFSFEANRVIAWVDDPPDHVISDVIADVTLF
jgi:ribonuclease HI